MNQPLEQSEELEKLEEPRQVWIEKGDLAYWADTALNAERARIAPQVRLAHLAKTGRKSPDTEEYLKLARATEIFADSRLAALIASHPTWPWASRILGAGKENYPKIVGLIEKFARHYDIHNPAERAMVPPHVKRLPQPYLQVSKGKIVEKEGIWVEGIERLETPSKLWKYMGLDVDPETHEVPKRRAGKKVGFNMELRMAVYRGGTSLLRAKGIWYYGSDKPGYSLGYEGLRQRIIERMEVNGIQIVPTPKERRCLHCNIEVVEKKTLYCPQCGEKLSLKVEPPGFLFQGHLHMKAMREMVKDFTLCLWLVWREALGLPVTQAYKVVKLNHKPIDPWKMVDRDEPMSTSNPQGGSEPLS